MDKERNSRPSKKPRKKVCMFCADRIEKIDYKDLAKLRKCMTERAKILPRRVTGTCAYHQRELTVAIKRARHIALLPYVNKDRYNHICHLFSNLKFITASARSSPSGQKVRSIEATRPADIPLCPWSIKAS